MSTYILNGKTLMLNGKKIKFEYDISVFVEMDSYIILSLRDAMTGDVTQQPFNNILAIDYQGNTLWRIEDIVKELFKGMIHRLYENKYLIASSGLGIYYKIDIENRALLKREGFTFGAPDDWGR